MKKNKEQNGGYGVTQIYDSYPRISIFEWRLEVLYSSYSKTESIDLLFYLLIVRIFFSNKSWIFLGQYWRF